MGSGTNRPRNGAAAFVAGLAVARGFPAGRSRNAGEHYRRVAAVLADWAERGWRALAARRLRLGAMGFPTDRSARPDDTRPGARNARTPCRRPADCGGEVHFPRQIGGSASADTGHARKTWPAAGGAPPYGPASRVISGARLSDPYDPLPNSFALNGKWRYGPAAL